MILLDTNVVSELMRPSPAVDVVDWIAAQPLSELYLSSISEAELRYGGALLPAGGRREQLLAAIEGMLREDFAGRILSFDSDAARAYAAIGVERRSAGRPISHADCQIAAIARSRGASVATRDMDDFADCGIAVINPWTRE